MCSIWRDVLGAFLQRSSKTRTPTVLCTREVQLSLVCLLQIGHRLTLILSRFDGRNPERFCFLESTQDASSSLFCRVGVVDIEIARWRENRTRLKAEMENHLRGESDNLCVIPSLATFRYLEIFVEHPFDNDLTELRSTVLRNYVRRKIQ